MPTKQQLNLMWESAFEFGTGRNFSDDTYSVRGSGNIRPESTIDRNRRFERNRALLQKFEKDENTSKDKPTE